MTKPAAVLLSAVLITACGIDRDLHAPASNPRFDTLVSLTEAKMRHEYAWSR